MIYVCTYLFRKSLQLFSCVLERERSFFMTETKTRGAGRGNNWATMVYPESAPENWKQALDDMHLDVLISPLHNKDINPNGESKKPHWHVLVKFPSVQTSKQAKEVFDVIGGVGCERVASFRNYARYLCHLDNPDKARYDENDVIALGALRYFDIIEVPDDKYEMIGQIMDFCDLNKIYSFAQIMRISRKHKPAWYRALCDNAGWAVKEFLKASLWESQNKTVLADESRLIDPATGELLGCSEDE